MEFPNIRYHGLHIPNLLSEEDQKRLSDLIHSPIFISQRIGSESQVGTIWLSSLKNMSFVIKVQSNRNKAHQEFEIQNYLSHRYPKNFLLTYDFIDDSKNRNVIFMETAIGDLSQVIMYSIVDENMLTGYILDVIDSVEIMSTEKVFHRDLHIRQIFIVVRDLNIKKAVIGDFGEHLRIDSPTMHLSDLKTFFKSLLEIIQYVKSSDKFISRITKCLEFICRQSSYIEFNDLSYDLLSLQQDISDIKNFFF